MIKEFGNELVGKIVSHRPELAKVFERHQIDYCCRGNTRLSDACRERNVELGKVLLEIDEALQSDDSPPQTNWEAESLVELIDHIVEKHHAFLREELPRLTGLIEKVNSAHGMRHPELAEVATVFSAMRSELESHMLKEENILFPAVEAMETMPEPCRFAFGSVNNPIRMMVHEHDVAGNALREIRRLTNDFEPPKDACPTFRVMLESLSRLEKDLHQHIHLENNILFPRAMELEDAAIS